MSFCSMAKICATKWRAATGGADPPGAECGWWRERVASREVPRFRTHDGDLRRDEFAAAAHSERNAHFQEPSLYRFLGEQVVRSATPAQRAETFTPLFEMAKRGLLRTKVEKTYSLGEAKAALAHAAQNKRSGKIIFEFNL